MTEKYTPKTFTEEETKLIYGVPSGKITDEKSIEQYRKLLKKRVTLEDVNNLIMRPFDKMEYVQANLVNRLSVLQKILEMNKLVDMDKLVEAQKLVKEDDKKFYAELKKNIAKKKGELPKKPKSAKKGTKAKGDK